MGFDLSGRGGYFRWNALGWLYLLELAEEYGWQPIGTGPPRGMLKADWPGFYHCNEGQRFYARDASRLAEALSRFLDATSKSARARKRERARRPDSFFLTSAGRDSLTEFIAYCRAGSFRLH